jgi:hypothetical protein
MDEDHVLGKCTLFSVQTDVQEMNPILKNVVTMRDCPQYAE